MNDKIIDEKKANKELLVDSTQNKNGSKDILFTSEFNSSIPLKSSTPDFILEQETTFVEVNDLSRHSKVREESNEESVTPYERLKSENEVEKRRLHRKIATLENDIIELNLILKDYSRKNADLQKEQDHHVSNENNELKRRIEFLNKENQKIKSEFIDSRKFHEFQKSLELQLEELRKENSRLNVENHAQRLQIDHNSLESKEKIHNLEMQKFDLQNLLLQKEEKVMQQEKRIELVLLEIEKNKEELNYFKNNLLEKEKEILEKNKDIELLRNDLLICQAQIDKILLEKSDLNNIVEIKNEELTLLKNNLLEQENENLEKTKKSELLNNEILSYQSQIEKILAEKKEFYNRSKDYNERLCIYAKFLNRKKVEISTEFEFLLKEYQTAELSHPVQDYLDFTNIEILRLEKQLRSTPTVSIERVQLEQSLNKLIEQRELLESVINKRKSDLSIRVSKLKDTIGKTLFDLVPPPPPKNLNLE